MIRKKVLCIGNSITEGWNCSDPDHTWPKLLENAMAGRNQRGAYQSAMWSADFFDEPTYIGAPVDVATTGIGRRGIGMFDGDAVLFPDVTASEAKLWLANSDGAGAVYVAIDGAVATTDGYLDMLGVENQQVVATVTNINTATSTIELGWWISADDWTPADTVVLGGWQSTVHLLLGGVGSGYQNKLRFLLNDGVAHLATTTAATGWADGSGRWVRVLVDLIGQTVTFQHSNDPYTTALGSITWSTIEVVALSGGAVGSIISTSTACLGVTNTFTGANPWLGDCRHFWGKIDGSFIWNLDFGDKLNDAWYFDDSLGTRFFGFEATGARTVSTSDRIWVDSNQNGADWEMLSVDLTLGLATSHTIEVGYEAKGGGVFWATFLAGIEPSPNVLSNVLNAGKAGYKATDFMAFPGDTLVSSLATEFDPDVVLIEFGANERTGQQDMATFEAGLQSVIDAVRDGAPNAQIVMTLIYQPENDTGPTYFWDDYAERIRLVAEVNDLELLDFSDWPQVGTVEGDATGYYADSVHLTDDGAEAFADRAYEMVLDLSAPSLDQLAEIDVDIEPWPGVPRPQWGPRREMVFPELLPTMVDGNFKLLCVGDSITERWSASTPEQSWIFLLQEALRAWFPVDNNEALGYLPAWRNASTGAFTGVYRPTLDGNAVGKTNAGPGFRSLQLGQSTGEMSWFAIQGTDGGTWTITYGGDTSTPIPYTGDKDVDEVSVMDAMNAMPSIAGDIVSIFSVEGIFDPLFPEFSTHYFPQWDVSAGNITPGTVDGSGLTGSEPDVDWLTWSSGGVAGSVTYEDLDADMIDVWLRYSAFVNGVTVAVDGVDVASFGAASNAGDHDSNGHYVYLGPGTHDVEIREDDIGGFPGQLDGIFAWKGDGPSDGYMRIDANEWISAGDSNAFDVTTSIEVVCYCALDDWTSGAIQSLVNKYDNFSGNQRSWRFQVNADGTLGWVWSTDGASATTVSSTDPALVNGEWKYLKVVFTLSNRTASFYTSDDGVVWTLVSSSTPGAATTIFNSTAGLHVSSITSASPLPPTGNFRYVEVTIDGNVVANPDFRVGRQRNPDAAGNTWSTAGSVGFDEGLTDPFGIHVIEAARGGATTSSFAQGATGYSTAYTDLADWVEGFDPDAITLALCVNDWSLHTDPRVSLLNLQAIVEGLRDGKPGVPIIIIPWFEPHPAYHYDGTTDYEIYVAVQHWIAEAYENVEIVNFYKDPEGTGLETNASWRPADVPGGRLDTNLGFGLHPGNTGSQQIADKLFDALVGTEDGDLYLPFRWKDRLGEGAESVALANLLLTEDDDYLVTEDDDLIQVEG